MLTITNWEQAFTAHEPATKVFLNEVLPPYLLSTRWFGAKSSKVKSYNIERSFAYNYGNNQIAYLLFVEIIAQNAGTETYFLPVCLTKDAADKKGILCPIVADNENYSLIDALFDEDFRNSIFKNILNESTNKLNDGTLIFEKGRCLRGYDKKAPIKSRLLNAEQSNTTLVYNDAFYLKIYRKLFRGANPDYELTQFLSEKSDFKYRAAFAGSLTWKQSDIYTVSLGLMQEKIPNQGDAWTYFLEQIDIYFIRMKNLHIKAASLPKVPLYKPINTVELPDLYKTLMGYDLLQKIETLGKTTAQMHLALFANRYDRHFSPTTFSSDYRVWLLNRLMAQLDSRYSLLEQNYANLNAESKEFADIFMANKETVTNYFLNFDEDRLNSNRIRIHGDYHLGQVLVNDDDFYILDFEGEPESTIRDRKVKQPPLKDVAGLLRSLHYAVFATIFNKGAGYDLPQAELMEAGGRYYRVAVGVFLKQYLDTATNGGLNIGYHAEIDFLLKYHILEKAVYELGYELKSRPDWVMIPLKGIMQILNND